MIGFRIPAEAGNISLHRLVQTGSGAHPASYQMGTRSSFPGGEADHSPPSGAEVRNAWSCTSTPQYSFIVWCSVNFTFYLYAAVYKYKSTQNIRVCCVPGIILSSHKFNIHKYTSATENNFTTSAISSSFIQFWTVLRDQY